MTSQMTMPRGSISCLLCKGAISVRAGNLDKFKAHVESNHDVFFEHDILIAINFLEDHEKEVIIEKVLPRMRLLFDNMSNGKVSISEKLLIDKRLREYDSNEVELVRPVKKSRHNSGGSGKMDRCLDSSIELSDTDRSEDMNIGKNSDNQHNIKFKQMEDDYNDEVNDDAVSVGSETLSESIQSVRAMFKENDEFTDCDECHQSVRKSVFDFHKKSHLTAQQTVECEICRKVMLKKSMYKHKRRCEILNTSKNSSRRDSNESDHKDDVKVPMKPVTTSAQNANGVGESPKTSDRAESQCYICKKSMLKGNINRHIRMVHGNELEFKCKICATGFQKIESLKLHTTKEHNLELEDIEQNENRDDKPKDFVKSEDSKLSVKLDPEILEMVRKSEEEKRDEYKDGLEVDRFECIFCGKAYSNKDSLRRHKKKHHTDTESARHSSV